MSGPIFVLHIWCGKIFAESLSMIDCYISQIQTPSQRVSLSMFEFSSPAFFSFQVHKRPVYVQLEILSHPYCLISFQNPSAQYHFCHIVSPPRHFGNGTPCWNSELSSVYWASLTTSSLWCKSSHTNRPQFNLFFSCFDLVCPLFLLRNCFVFITWRWWKCQYRHERKTSGVGMAGGNC